MRAIETDHWDLPLVKEKFKAKNWNDENLLLVRHKAGQARKRVFVLVHGVNGHPITDWKFFMPNAFDTLFCEVDIAIYKYQNPPKIGKLNFRFRVERAITDLQKECFIAELQCLQGKGYTEIVLLGHSFGGIFLRKILQYLITYKHKDSYSTLLENIHSVFYFATPFAGSHSFLLLLKSMIRGEKILCAFNNELDELSQWWRKSVTHDPILVHASDKVLIQEWGLIGLKDRWVKPMSAKIALEDDRYKSFADRDHNTIKNLSDNKDDAVYRYLSACLHAVDLYNGASFIGPLSSNGGVYHGVIGKSPKENEEEGAYMYGFENEEKTAIELVL